MESSDTTTSQSNSAAESTTSGGSERDANLLRGAFGSRLRQHPRQFVDHDVFLAQANGAGPLVARGTCLDISRGGLRAELDSPCGTGDVYQIVVAKGGDSAVEPRFARCLRCAVAPEGRFEASFQFLVPVELPRVGR
jgi:hypothetical protein